MAVVGNHGLEDDHLGPSKKNVPSACFNHCMRERHHDYEHHRLHHCHGSKSWLLDIQNSTKCGFEGQIFEVRDAVDSFGI